MCYPRMPCEGRGLKPNLEVPVYPMIRLQTLPKFYHLSVVKLASLNINKWTTHIDELRVLLANNDTDVLSIKETKLIKNASDDEVHIL